MGTYGVTYGGRKPTYMNAPGQSKRSLASLMSGSTSMQPLSSAKPQGFAPLPASSFQPISDNLNSIQVANKNRLAAVTTPPSGTPATTPTTAPRTTAPPAPMGPLPTWADSDPILAQIKAIGQRNVGDAETGAGANARNSILNAGGVKQFPSLASLFAGDPTSPILGALSDQQNEQAAEANPYSTLAQLRGAHDKNVGGIDQTTNGANLYYGSTHANALADELNSYLGQENTAGQQLGDLLQQANSSVLAAKQNAQDQLIAALPAAYQRAVDAASANGGDPTAVQPPPSSPPPAGGNSTGALPGGGGAVFLDANDPDVMRKALMLARNTGRPVGF